MRFFPWSLVVVLGCSSSASSVPVDAGIADAAPGTCAVGAGDASVVLELPKPTGPNALGRRRFRIDTTRDESETTDTSDKRSITVELTYPAEPCGGTFAPYFDDAEGAPTPGNANWWKGIGTHTCEGAPFVADGQRHPVLVFSHAYAAMPRMYTAFIEEMASRGYVVAAVAHSYWAFVTSFPDGATIAGKHTTVPTDSAVLDAENAVWIEDGKSTLDALATYDASDPAFMGRLDLSKVGYFGHSFGGATAINLLAHDPRVLAAVDLDGGVFGPDRTTSGPVVGKPSLFFLSNRFFDFTIDAVFTKSTAPAWRLTIPAAKHLNFGDFPLLEPVEGISFGSNVIGSIDGCRGIWITNHYVAAFFDQALRGVGSPLLDAASGDYPDVGFEKRN